MSAKPLSIDVSDLHFPSRQAVLAHQLEQFFHPPKVILQKGVVLK
jgi:hypothetical protein